MVIYRHSYRSRITVNYNFFEMLIFFWHSNIFFEFKNFLLISLHFLECRFFLFLNSFELTKFCRNVLGSFFKVKKIFFLDLKIWQFENYPNSWRTHQIFLNPEILISFRHYIFCEFYDIFIISKIFRNVNCYSNKKIHLKRKIFPKFKCFFNDKIISKFRNLLKTP